MSKDQWLELGVAFALVGVFALGRYTVPEKVKIVTQTVEVEKKKQDIQNDQDKHKETTITQVKQPDGTVQTTTKVVEDSTSHTDSKTTTQDTITQVHSKEIVRGDSKVTVSALVGAHLTFGENPLVYGGSITKPILGPLNVGAWGMSNSTAGFSIGFTF